MSTLKLYSSCVVPFPGIYRVSHISKEDFREICEIYKKGNLKIESYIGYDSCIQFVNKIAGLDFLKNKEPNLTLSESDIILVCKVKGRMSFYEKTHLQPTESDFQFAKIEFLGE